MSLKELPKETTRIRFLVPSLTKDKKKIPPDVREKVIKGIKESCTNLNVGATEIPNCRGIYRSEAGEYINEDITIIETNGENPFSEQEMSFLCKDLNQEVLLVEEAGKIKPYLYDAEPQKMEEYRKAIFADGSKMFLYREEIDPDSPEGELVHFVEEYDEFGKIKSFGYYPMGDFFEDEPLPQEVYDYMQERVDKYLKEYKPVDDEFEKPIVIGPDVDEEGEGSFIIDGEEV